MKRRSVRSKRTQRKSLRKQKKTNTRRNVRSKRVKNVRKMKRSKKSTQKGGMISIRSMLKDISSQIGRINPSSDDESKCNQKLDELKKTVEGLTNSFADRGSIIDECVRDLKSVLKQNTDVAIKQDWEYHLEDWLNRKSNRYNH